MWHLRTRTLKTALHALITLGITACGQSSGIAIGEESVASNETDIGVQMIALIKEVSLQRQQNDPQGLVRRFNQAKTIACAHGEMEVLTTSEPLAVGLFSTPTKYPVTLRFANATKADDRESDLRGLSIRVKGATRATGAGGTPGVQDFTLNSYPALFAGTPEDFLSFIKATASDRLWWYLVTHPKSLWIGFQARGKPTSPLNVEYFSTTPFRHGSGTAVKYAARACDEPGSRVTNDHKNYLRDALRHDLRKTQCINFQVQFQTDTDLMPLEDASVIWPEEISPFVTVAKIMLPAQKVNDVNDLAECERMTFNPWNGLPEHKPLGGVNRVRQQLYNEIGKFRTEQNKGY